MRRIQEFTLVIFFAIGFNITFTFADAGGGESTEQGQAVYQRHCASCHGVDGKGKGPAASTLPAKPTDFTNPNFWSDNADRKIDDAVINGHKSMPPIKMSQNDIKAVSEYMSHIFKQ